MKLIYLNFKKSINIKILMLMILFFNFNIKSNQRGYCEDNANFNIFKNSPYHSKSLKNYKRVALNGTYTVGVGGNYTTLTAAIDDFNSAPITGPVTLKLTDSFYPSETFPIDIRPNTGSSATNRLTIRPAEGVDVTFSGSDLEAVIAINKADYVTIDGSNNGTNSRNLTLINTYSETGHSPYVVWIYADANLSADYAVVKNCNVIGSGNATYACIRVAGSNSNSKSNQFFTIENNVCKNAYRGILASGTSAQKSEGGIIKNNIVGSNVDAEKIGTKGISNSLLNNFEVSGNTIFNLTDNTPDTFGLSIGGDNGIIKNNIIYNIENTYTYRSAGIYLGLSTVHSNIVLKNNFVRDIYSKGGQGEYANGYGIYVDAYWYQANFTNIKIYNNTVGLNKNQQAIGASAALYYSVHNTATGKVDFKNNIFVNNQTASGNNFAIDITPSTEYFTMDYNNYYSATGYLGHVGNNDVSTLSDLQTTNGQDAHSANISPNFISTDDLHLATNNINLDNLGMPLPEVLDDIDGQTRSTTTPDIGADEFSSNQMNTENNNVERIKYFPNPVKDVLNISTKKEISKVVVYHLDGGLALDTAKISKNQVDLKSLNRGIYIVKLIFYDHSQSSFKIIKE